MQKGDRMQCALLGRDGKRTGQTVPVEVREIKRHWQTGEPTSVRVKYDRKGKDAWIWVQAEMLSELVSGRA